MALSVAVNQQGVITPEKLYIFELKYAISESEANKIQNPKSESAKPEKVKQVYKYLKNAKSLTESKEAIVCTLVIYPEAENKDKFIQFKLGSAKIVHSSAVDTTSSSQEESPNNSGSQAASGEAGYSNREGSLSKIRTRSKSRSRTNDQAVYSDSSPDKRSRLRGSKAEPLQVVDAQVLPGQSGSSGYDASSSGSSADKRSGRKRTSSSIVAQENQDTPHKKRKRSCRTSKKGSRSKREADIVKGLCIFSREMLENKKRQQQQFHALNERLDQALLVIQSAPPGWHIYSSDSPQVTSDSYLSAITRGFAVSVWEDKVAIFFTKLSDDRGISAAR